MKTTHNRHSLRSRLTLAFAITALLPLLAMGVFALFLISLANRAAVVNVEHQASNAVLVDAEKFLGDVLSVLDVRVGFSQNSPIEPRDQKFLVDQLLQANPYILDIAFLDTDGKETTRGSQIRDTELVESQNRSDQDGFVQALHGNAYISNVNFTGKDTYVVVFSPVRNKNGDTIMVVRALVSVKPLAGIVDKTPLGKTGEVVIVDAEGRLVAVPKHVPQNLDRQAAVDMAMKSHGLSEEFGYQVKTDAGSVIISSSQQMHSVPWTVMVLWPTTEANAVVGTLRNYMIGFTAGALGLVVLLGWFMGKRILVPLTKLTESAEAIGKGKFNEVINVKTGDELETLGTAFESMEKDLEQLQRLKVAEAKTEALAETLRRERQLSKIKEDFITNTSHQLRTPLATIRWSSQLLVKGITDNALKGLAEGVNAGVKDLSAIVQDLITVSNFGFGYKNKKTDAVDIAGLLGELKTKYQPRLKELDIAYTERFDTQLKSIGDSEALRVVFENLLDNAITYTGSQGTIDVRIEEQDKQVLISIKDSGIGITTKDQRSIFNQFFRATNSIVRKNVGTGLGLYICKLIIAGHRGKIWFDSTEGHGSTFYILLPAKH